MKSIYLDNFQIHNNISNSLGYHIKPDIEGLDYPDLRTSRYNRAGEHGGFMSNQLYGGRKITLEGSIYANTAIDYEAKRRALVAILDLEKSATGIPLAKVLKLTTMDDLQLQTDVFLLNFKMAKAELMIGEFLLDLWAPDFPLYSQNSASAQLYRASGGGFILPVIFPIVTTAQSGGTVNITNNGTADSYPTIYLNGPLNNPIIQNNTTGKYIKLNLTIATGEQVTIDMKNRTVKLGSSSIIANMDSESLFWVLLPGLNIISLTTSSTSDTGDAQITYRDAYLGV